MFNPRRPDACYFVDKGQKSSAEVIQVRALTCSYRTVCQSVIRVDLALQQAVEKTTVVNHKKYTNIQIYGSYLKGILKQGVVLTGRNTTGAPSRAPLVSYVAPWSVTDDDDRRQRPLLVRHPTLCAGGPVIKCERNCRNKSAERIHSFRMSFIYSSIEQY